MKSSALGLIVFGANLLTMALFFDLYWATTTPLPLEPGAGLVWYPVESVIVGSAALGFFILGWGIWYEWWEAPSEEEKP